MAPRGGAVPQQVPAAENPGLATPAPRGRTAASFHALLPTLAGAWLVYVALGVLLYSPALRVFDAGQLPFADALRSVAYTLAPNVLLDASRHTPIGAVVLAIYTLLVGLALVCWCRAVRISRRLDDMRLLPLLLLTAALATCPLMFAGLFSDDVYLYHAYGRIIETYGANPVYYAPAAFPDDPLLPWVFWKDLPSAYGPLWLMLSAGLSRVAGDSATAAVVIYRFAGLLLHLGTAAAIWVLLQRLTPREAAAGTIFYAWNPLVVVEVVANAHNDVLVALFAVMMVAAAASRAWSSAAFLGACALMVKPFAVLLLAPLGLRMLRATRRPERMRTIAIAMAVGVGTILAINLPLWSGTRLLANISMNPASHMYTNTFWELLSGVGLWFGVRTVDIQTPYLDWLRTACLLGGAAWILGRRWTHRGVAETAVPLWLLFCLTAPWVWPWYFVPAIALAPLARGTALASGAALTVGGLLFWITWPPHPEHAAWLHTWRSLVLFGPLVLTLTCPPVRHALLAALGARASTAHPATVLDARLRALKPQYPV